MYAPLMERSAELLEFDWRSAALPAGAVWAELKRYI